MADSASVEQPTQEIENKTEIDEPKEETVLQTEEVAAEKVISQLFALLVLLNYPKLF